MLLEGEASPPPVARTLAGWQRPGCGCRGLGTRLAEQPLSLLESSPVLQLGLWCQATADHFSKSKKQNRWLDYRLLMRSSQ